MCDDCLVVIKELEKERDQARRDWEQEALRVQQARAEVERLKAELESEAHCGDTAFNQVKRRAEGLQAEVNDALDCKKEPCDLKRDEALCYRHLAERLKAAEVSVGRQKKEIEKLRHQVNKWIDQCAVAETRASEAERMLKRWLDLQLVPPSSLKETINGKLVMETRHLLAKKRGGGGQGERSLPSGELPNPDPREPAATSLKRDTSEPCPRCGGTGVYWTEVGFKERGETCEGCNGTGKAKSGGG